MKGFARRNQLIITGLAIMIAVAGYLHFTSEGGAGLSEAETEEEQDNKWVEEGDAQAYLLRDDDDSVETMTEDTETEQTKEKKKKKDSDQEVAQKEEQGEDQYADISAEDLGVDEDGEKTVAENDKTEDTNTKTEGEDIGDSVETEGKEIAETENSIGEAVLVNNTLEGDYFSSAKLSREQTRARNEETLMDIVNSTKMEEAQKQDAVNSLIHLTEVSEMETATETLLGAKGFENSIVTITSDSVDVVVDAEGLTKQQIVQIQDIVKRKTKVAVENIVITTVAVKN